MEKPFKLEQTTPTGGDCCAGYQVTIIKPDFTIGDLCDYVVKEIPRDWGSVEALGHKMEYKWGKVLSDNIPDDIKKKVLKKCFANGGWSLMDYIIREGDFD